MLSYLLYHSLSSRGVLALGKFLVGKIKRNKGDDRDSNCLHGNLRIGTYQCWDALRFKSRHWFEPSTGRNRPGTERDKPKRLS